MQAGVAGGLSDSHTVGGEGDHCTREEASVEEGRASRGAAWGLGDLWGQSTDINNLCAEKQQQTIPHPWVPALAGAHGLGQHSPSFLPPYQQVLEK